MMNDEESGNFIAHLCAEVADLVRQQRHAVQYAVSVALQKPGRVPELAAARRESAPTISADMASAGAAMQWAQEQAAVRAYGARMQADRDAALAEINAEQARKRAAAYARNRENQRGD